VNGGRFGKKYDAENFKKMPKMSTKEQLKLIKRGAVEIIQEEELAKKLEKSLKTKKPLIVKAGFDPSAPDIHVGHTVLLRKLRHFQDLGHKVMFLIGDFTGMIGDPSGRSEIRKQLSKEEVLENAKTYKKQVFKVLDSNPKKIEIVFNSHWMAKMKIEEMLNLASKYTVARMLERDDFLKRYKSDQPISILEFLYPLIQGYDSVVLKADIELGGTDQKFNLLVGRQLQRDFGQDPQVVLTMPLLVGLDGVQKMSKTYNNYVGINEPPNEIYGKVMSLSDELMPTYYELLTDLTLDKNKHPKETKKILAAEIVKNSYSKKEALNAEKEFEKVFKDKGLPSDIPELTLNVNEINIIDLLVESGSCNSKSQARRLIEQGGVYCNEKRIKDPLKKLQVTSSKKILKTGKRFFISFKKG